MSRRNRMMSEEMKKELAKELGFYDTVQKEGWGAIKAKDAGNMVKRAIQLAEQAVAKQYQAQQQGQQPAAYTAAYQPQNQQTGRTTYMPQQQQSYAANSRTETPASRVTVPAYMHQAAQAAQQPPNHYPH